MLPGLITMKFNTAPGFVGLADREPRDFAGLGVNRAFEALTGWVNVLGESAWAVIPGIRKSNSERLAAVGRVAQLGAVDFAADEDLTVEGAARLLRLVLGSLLEKFLEAARQLGLRWLLRNEVPPQERSQP